MAWTYRVYGLRVRSEGEIPGLAPGDPSEPADLHIRTGMPDGLLAGHRECRYRSADLNHLARPNLVIWRTIPHRSFHFVYDDNTDFLIDADGREIWCRWSGEASAADAAIHLRGAILGMALRLRGVVCLHASSIVIGRTTVALAGYAGTGKSTTAAGFATLGFPVLADDVSALQLNGDTVCVLPGPTRLSLWPDAAMVVYGGALPRLTPTDGVSGWWDKRYIDVDHGDVSRFHSSPLELSAIYVLAPRAAGPAALQFEAMSSRHAFMALADVTYVNYVLDEGMRAAEFRMLGHLARTVPVRQITPPDDPARLHELCRAILADHDALTAARA